MIEAYLDEESIENQTKMSETGSEARPKAGWAGERERERGGYWLKRILMRNSENIIDFKLQQVMKLYRRFDEKFEWFLMSKFRKDIAIFFQFFLFLNKNLQKHSHFSKQKVKKWLKDSKGSAYWREGQDFAAPTPSPYPPRCSHR
jgi:hypothetical protein